MLTNILLIIACVLLALILIYLIGGEDWIVGVGILVASILVSIGMLLLYINRFNF